MKRLPTGKGFFRRNSIAFVRLHSHCPSVGGSIEKGCHPIDLPTSAAGTSSRLNTTNSLSASSASSSSPGWKTATRKTDSSSASIPATGPTTSFRIHRRPTTFKAKAAPTNIHIDFLLIIPSPLYFSTLANPHPPRLTPRPSRQIIRLPTPPKRSITSLRNQFTLTQSVNTLKGRSFKNAGIV